MESDALQRGRDFVSSIMLDIEHIPDKPGTGVMRGIKGLKTGIPNEIFIREITQSFWEECIRVVKTTNKRVRLCAVGTPGIGKTTSTPLLIRMLLEERATVVYRLRPEVFLWEFKMVNEEYTVNVYPHDLPLQHIKSLNKDSTFYIVDAGDTSDNCVPPDSFACRTIIVASPDGSHWGGKHFLKEREKIIGRFRHFPMWDLDELLLAQRFLTNTGVSTNEEIVRRFRLVGGVPRHIFAEDEDFRAILLGQDDAVFVLTAEEAQEIVTGQLNAVGTFDSKQPKSAIIGYAKAKTVEILPFESRQVEIVSSSVEEKVINKFMARLWNLMLQDDRVGWKIFKAYCRAVMSTPPGRSFLRHPCCGKVAQRRCKKSYFLLGGCHTIRLVVDPCVAAMEGEPMTLFHSVDRRHQFFDFIYKDTDGMFHVFQVTLAKLLTAKREHILELRRTLGTSHLAVYYVIPADNHNNFVTAPANPTNKSDTLTKFWHILIPNPSEESH